ncbi:hypothetical protein GGI02_001759 [Coemansia sp. RSA 2322]|nr:hypothetical protein GGI02_001759 [Coemansia sp. RSA 2322]
MIAKLPLCLSVLLALVVTTHAADSAKSPLVVPPAVLPTHGNSQLIICQLNRDRQARSLAPVFLHRNLSQVAQQLGAKYSSGSLDSQYFNTLFNGNIAPLGAGVSSSYKLLTLLDNDGSFVTQIEQSIYTALFDRNLDAIGLYVDSGVYTIVLASGLAQKPKDVSVCPSSPLEYTPPGDVPPAQNLVNGVDLPQFICSINSQRTSSDASAFVVHTALNNEAWEQVKVMNSLGHYTVDGPRYVDQAIYSQYINVKKLYWMAGEGYRNARYLANLLVSTYDDYVLDPNYTVIGVAQLNGFWSVIMASLPRTPRTGKACPLTVDEITYTG